MPPSRTVLEQPGSSKGQGGAEGYLDWEEVGIALEVRVHRHRCSVGG